MPARVALPPANRAAIEQSLSVGMGRALHIHLKRLTRKGLAAEMTVSEDHINRSGRINGGILMSFADVLGAIGTVANLPEGYRTTTLESKTNFFAAGEGARAQAGKGVQGSGGATKGSLPASRMAGPGGTTTGAQAEAASSSRVGSSFMPLAYGGRGVWSIGGGGFMLAQLSRLTGGPRRMHAAEDETQRCAIRK